MQLLTLLAMESPTKADGLGSGESIRDAKVQVLKAILPVTMDDCLLGQYEGALVRCINPLSSYCYVHFSYLIYLLSQYQ